MTRDQAQQIALAAAGLGASVRHVNGPHDEHGQTVWTFEIEVGGQTREITVAQATGQVLRNEIHG